MSNLANQLAVAERQEVARGIRLLLGTPLLTERETPDAFDLVRRRREPIAGWFEYYCGWHVVVEPRLGYARLVKVGRTDDATRPARRSRSGRAPFDRRRYTLLCVVAAELLAVPVTTLGLLAERVVRATAADPVLVTFDTATRAERSAFADALLLLQGHGVVEAIDGSTEAFVGSAEAKVLYRVDATLLMRLLAAPVGVSQLGVPADEVASRFPELLSRISTETRYTDASEVQRNLWLRHSVFRRLADDPVVYHDDLTADQRAYLASPTGRSMLRRAAEQAGFELEERAEGIVFADVDALATDTRFPDDTATAKVAALLVLDALTEDGGLLALEQLHAHTADLLHRFPKWAKAYQGEDGPQRLLTDALDVLDRFGLVHATGGVVTARPAAYRYHVRAPRTNEESS